MLGRTRQNYTGEFVILEKKIADGTTEEKRQWIDNPIENHHISGRAAVIGSRVDQSRFQYQRLQRHKGGLLATKRLQTYGTGDLWTDMTFDFYVTTDKTILSELANKEYDLRSTVYTSARLCIENPSRFYPVPYLPVMDSLALSVYLAAFDGHQEIFLIGYNNDTPYGKLSWIYDVFRVIHAYPTTKFTVVGRKSNVPELWRNCKNVNCIDFREFVLYCDV
jgi:hypothetical protein